MTNRAAALRYARALLDVGIRESDPQQIESDLADFVALLKRHATLEKVLLNPAVPASRKHAAVAAITARAGMSSVLVKLLLLLAARDRLVLLPELLEMYRLGLLDHLQIVRADVTTAVPLTPERAQVIERGLADVTGKRVTVDARVDPAIIGGVIARIGSTVYDGSVVTLLARMREKLSTA